MIKEEYVYLGLGFPVILKNVKVINIRGVDTPKINLNKLMYYTLKKLAEHKTRLCGSHIRFIRTYFELPQEDFVNLFYLSSVEELEDIENDNRKLNWVFEKDIRFFIMSKVGDEAMIFKAYSNLQKERSIGKDEVIFSNEDIIYLE